MHCNCIDMRLLDAVSYRLELNIHYVYFIARALHLSVVRHINFQLLSSVVVIVLDVVI